MLFIKTDPIYGNKTQFKKLFCPKCGTITGFYNFAPDDCRKCKYRFPDVDLMMESKVYRACWHRGEAC